MAGAWWISIVGTSDRTLTERETDDLTVALSGYGGTLVPGPARIRVSFHLNRGRYAAHAAQQGADLFRRLTTPFGLWDIVHLEVCTFDEYARRPATAR